ncbi:MAG: hypothetical protein KF699_12510 [Phycisphaeraceae bacterium]|nr:hypothetical protein [Phycisphaeraceae bacterium]
MRDSIQLRGISQSLIIWANGNNGNYPLPSQIDTADFTVAESGRAKDTTANIFSILIFNGNISPEICISPAESSPSIARDEDFEYSNPKAAASPMNALWDPAFSADFTSAKGGNFSYGHLQPSGTRGDPAALHAARVPAGRLSVWRDTFSTTEAIIANRGPEISAVAADYTPTLKNKSSNTFLIHGGRNSWEGNVAYNDGHVAFETTLKPLSPGGAAMSYTTASGPRLDTIFFDEPDDVNQSNIFLGIFITAGEKPGEFKGIWD